MNDLNEKIFLALMRRQLDEALELVRQGVIAKHDWEGFQVNIANRLVALLPWSLVQDLLPKDTLIFEESGWLQSLVNEQPVNASGEPIPWFTYPAIDFLDDVVRPEMKIFEWGSGMSTIWWSRRTKLILSVEDNVNWYHVVQPMLPANAKLLFAEGAFYINAIDSVSHEFDVIVIDGSHRSACLDKAKKHLKPTGFIVFDNTDVVDYQEAIALARAEGWHRLDFWGLIPSYCYKNCTSILFRNPEAIQSQGTPATHRPSAGLSCSQALTPAPIS